MPYKDNESLPDTVKNALPADAQNIWRNAFNSAHAKDPDEEQANKIAWGAVTNAGWKKDDQGEWKKFAKSFDIDMEVFSVGTWNGDKYTEKDLDSMVSNFDILKSRVKPILKIGHEDSKWKDGMPSLGWATALKREGNKLIASFKEVPKLIYDLIKSGRYKRVSSEIYWNFKDSTGNIFNRVLSGVALLGADIPAVDNLADLTAYLTQESETGSFEKVATYTLDTKGGTIQSNEKGASKMGEEEIRKEYEAKLEAERKANAELKADNEKMKAQQEAEKKEFARKEKETRTNDLKAFCEDQVKGKKMTPAQRDVIVNAIDKHVYTDDAGFSFTFDLFKEFIEKGGIFKVDDKEYGKHSKDDKDMDDKTAGEKIHAFTVKKVAESNGQLDYSQAMQFVIGEHPDIAEEWTKGGNE